MRLFVTLWLILTPLIGLTAENPDNDDARSRWAEAYKIMEIGQRHEDREESADALEQFRNAEAQFKIIQQTNPQWNPALISFRIQHCRQQIDQLEKKLGTPAPAQDAPRDYQKLYGILLEKAKRVNDAYLNQKVEIAQLRESLAAAQSEAARLSDRESKAEALAALNHELTGQLAARDRQLREQSEEIIRLKQSAGLEDELAKLRRDQEVTQQRAKDLDAERRRLLVETETLRADQKRLSLERAEALDKAGRFDKEIALLREQNIQAVARVEQLMADNRRLVEDIPLRENRIKSIEKELADAQTLLNEQARKLNEAVALAGQQDASQKTLAAQNAELATLRSEQAAGRRAAEQQADTARRLQTSVENTNRELDQLQSANRRLREELATRENAGSATTRAIAELQQQNIELQATNAAFTSENNTLKTRDAAQTAMVRAMREEITQLKNGQAAIDQKRQQAEDALAAVSATSQADADARLEGHRLTVIRLQRELADSQKQSQQLQTALIEARSVRPPQNDAETVRLREQLAELVTNLAAARRAEKEAKAKTEASTAAIAAARKAEKEARETTAASAAAIAAAREAERIAKEAAANLAKTVVPAVPAPPPPQPVPTPPTPPPAVAVQPALPPAVAVEPAPSPAVTVQPVLPPAVAVQPALPPAVTVTVQPVPSTTAAGPATSTVTFVTTTAATATAPLPQPSTTLADRSAADREAAIELLLVQADKAEQQGNREAARWNYQQVLEKDPQRQHALVRLGNILTDTGDFDSAERYLMRAFYNNPDDMELLMPLGFLLAHQGKGDLAVSMLSRAVALYPDNPDFHRYLGVACRSLDWPDAAEKQFLRSWKLAPTSPDTAFNLAVLLISAEPPRAAEARTWYDQARKLGAPADPALERLLPATP